LRQIKFGPFQDKFGFQSLKSFIDHVDHYQYTKYLEHNIQPIQFDLNSKGINVYDVFELTTNNDFQFTATNVIVVETLKQFLLIKNKLDNSKKYIVLSESFWDIKSFNIDLHYELVYVPWDLIDCQNRLANRSNLYFHLMDLNFLEKFNPQMDFLCLVGRSKHWRDKFIDKLTNNVDLSNSLTSYYGQCLGHQDLLAIDVPYERNNSKIEFEEKFYKPIRIADTNYHYNLSYFTRNELFYKTKFSVVVETEAELEEYHITEKTIKCLVLGHPFVVMGTPRYLKFLNTLGFKTYSTLFDESYDDILDINQRMQSVIDLINHLKNITFDIQALKQIQEHNLINLIKLRNQDTYEKFLGLFDVRNI
jgi:hypothetical protein